MVFRGSMWEEFNQQDFTGQTAIVTGANSGIGYETALALARVGAAVTMVCRSPGKCEAARNKVIQEAGSNAKVKAMTMDSSSLASVRAFAESYYEDNGHEQPIDMLFMNAGINHFPTSGQKGYKCPPKTKADDIEYMFQVNYLGHHLMYRLLEPLIAKSKQARIIPTSSSASFHSYSYGVATNLETLHGCSEKVLIPEVLSYGQSKLAQIVWVKALTRKLAKDTNVYANAYHPGVVNTPIMDKAYDTASMSEVVRKWTTQAMEAAWSPPDGALTGLYLAVNPGGVRGKYHHPQSNEVVNPMSLDEKLQDNLWDFSEQLVKEYLAPIEPPVEEAKSEVVEEQSETSETEHAQEEPPVPAEEQEQVEEAPEEHVPIQESAPETIDEEQESVSQEEEPPTDEQPVEETAADQ